MSGFATGHNAIQPPQPITQTNRYRIVMAISVAILLAYITSPTLHGPINVFLGRTFDHVALYQHTQQGSNKALLKTHYSIMHIPDAGIAVIYNINKPNANYLSDTTSHFSSRPFCISLQTDYFMAAGRYNQVNRLSDSYPLCVPQGSIAAVIVDMRLISDADLSAILRGLGRVQIGPRLTAGAYTVWDGDHDLITKLHKARVLEGRLQTVSDPHPFLSLPKGTIIVPLEKHQVMDVTVGQDTRSATQE